VNRSGCGVTWCQAQGLMDIIYLSTITRLSRQATMMARTKRIFGGPLQPQHEPRSVPEPVVSSADAKKFGFENVRWPL